jgi:hypothetical protein
VEQKEYQSMIGSLLYLTMTRPDILFSVCLCAHFQVSPRTSHQQAVKRIFRHLRYTRELGLWYPASSSLSLLGFWDADFAGCRVDRKSTSSTCQFLVSSLVSWSTRKQSSVAQSTTETKYGAAASCCSQLLWITYTLSGFCEECSHVPLTCDSTSAISVAKNLVLHSRTKHIEVKYHILRDNVEIETETSSVFLQKSSFPISYRSLWTKLHLLICNESLELFFPFECWLGELMYICMLHLHLCIIPCLHLCIIHCICNICHRDVHQ